ncbi:hypothetical protein BAU25_20075 [Bacillus albus]|uniref:Uncharacterized protein n=1 Tax=Bacillus albus TaxID=2026189 RepID=A0A1J9SUQ4_9BACI|nr:hypothetical protein BAU25_20075 [Bacillus albus]
MFYIGSNKEGPLFTFEQRIFFWKIECSCHNQFLVNRNIKASYKAKKFLRKSKPNAQNWLRVLDINLCM